MRFAPLVVGAATLLACSRSGAQSVAGQSSNRSVPECAAAMCEEETALVTALDTLLRHERVCRDAPPAVLHTLHWAPFTHLEDEIAGRALGRIGLPSSPVAMSLGQAGRRAFERYWSDISIVEAGQVARGSIPRHACLIVFAPVTWQGVDRVRVMMTDSREVPRHIAQRFIFLVRRGNRWLVERLETGLRS